MGSSAGSCVRPCRPWCAPRRRRITPALEQVPPLSGGIGRRCGAEAEMRVRRRAHTARPSSRAVITTITRCASRNACCPCRSCHGIYYVGRMACVASARVARIPANVVCCPMLLAPPATRGEPPVVASQHARRVSTKTFVQRPVRRLQRRGRVRTQAAAQHNARRVQYGGNAGPAVEGPGAMREP